MCCSGACSTRSPASPRGLADLEQRNYRVRLPRPQARELAAITDRFNALAEALEAARAENQRLNHRLITAQDDERRRTALELHDEVGPSLFGLKANAGSIATAAAALPEQAARKMAERVRDMLAIIEHLQAINRSMLNRLRPMALGHVPLQRHPVRAGARARAAASARSRSRSPPTSSTRSYGNSIDLTIYRCVQESLTNAIRHAQAKHVGVELGEVAARWQRRTASPARADGARRRPRHRSRRAAWVSACAACRSACKGSAAAIRSRARTARGTCVRIVIPLRPLRRQAGAA